MAQWVSDVTAASGMSSRSVFGSPRDVDFSQFKPRGHYEDPPEGSPEARATARPLSRYFRSVMWLGRIDARITVPGRSGAPELRRRELELACGLRALMGPAEMTAWRQLEAAMNAFVGERDAMGPADVDRFYGDLGIAGYSHLPEVSDAKVLETLARGKYGYQRIASHPLAGGLEHTAPLPSSFSFTGERYIVDSHVLSDVVYDRVIPPPGKTPRMMPSPLDVAFAVFGNDVAGALLKPELETFGYGPNLQDARRHVEDGGAGLWDTSLYNLWMGALRTLSSRPTGRLPAVATTEAWDRRLLTSQLASWAELRHDTILYAKQSYSAMALCSFPDAYVEPYPALYGRFERFAARGKSLLDALDFSGATYVRDRAGQFFAQLGKVAQQLGHIAAAQQRGERPSREDLAWVNQALVEDPPSGGGCGASPRTVHGWYVDLFYDGNVLAFKPTIADVHTQPTDAAGNVVGRVLHVATGAPRLMVVNVDGARSFVGVVSDYSEVVTSGFQRLTDEEWRTRIQRGNAEDVPWMREIVAR
jgi:hypothetical protein